MFSMTVMNDRRFRELKRKEIAAEFNTTQFGLYWLGCLYNAYASY